MTITDNLSLNLFSPGVDLDEGFQQYRIKLDGPENSNMTIIDEALGITFPTLIANLASTASGSKTTITNTLSSISGSIGTINSDLDTIDARFIRLAQHSGSGQADFNNISGSYTHILILGMAIADTPSGTIYNIGLDFNGITTAASYASIQWNTEGSYVASTGAMYENEQFIESTANGQIVVGKVSGSYNQSFGSAFMVLIPNYSASSVLYKTALGMSAFIGYDLTTDPYDVGRTSLATMGGYWKAGSAITRIRIFSGSATTTRYNFDTGTKISMYGLI